MKGEYTYKRTEVIKNLWDSLQEQSEGHDPIHLIIPRLILIFQVKGI